MNPTEAFLNLLFAAMTDAAIERKMTQLKTTVAPDGKKTKFVRIIIIPEELDYNWPAAQPLGTDVNQN